MGKNNSSTELEKRSEYLIKIFTDNSIYLKFDNRHRRIFLDKYVIYYTSKFSAVQTLGEIFVNMAYRFQTSSAIPFIVDAGSEVGIATIFFKIFYPRAKILCFEAHPYVCKILRKNIRVNGLQGVTVVNAALINGEDKVDFFGESDFVSDELDTRGSSIAREWGMQRATSSVIKVRGTRLSKYIEERVDYLKLNIEGAEQQVIEDLENMDKLKYIDRILIKFHQAAGMKNSNDLEYILDLLVKNNLAIKNKLRKDPMQVFPRITKKWTDDNEVSLYTVLLERIRQQRFENGNAELQKKLLLLKISSSEKNLYLLKNIIDNVPSSVYWKDRDGLYLGQSAYAVNKLHNTNIAPTITDKNIVGMSDYDLFYKDVADRYRKNDLYVMENKREFIVEEKVITPEGKELVQISSKKPLYDEKMDVVGIIGSTIDITDCRHAEQLQKDKDIAEQVCRAVEVLAGAIAHEIRNPLCVISLNIEKLETTKLTTAEISSIGNIKLAIRRSSNIIDMLLIKLHSIVNNKIDHGNGEICSIKHSINETLSEYPFYESERQRIVWDANLHQDFTYRGNGIFIKHVLFNLIKNSLRAIKEAEKGEIYIGLALEGDCNRVIFRDTALGIRSKEIATSLFLPFVGSSGGRGIGLAFCKMTMESYGGSISCNSVYGEYADFVLSFPRLMRN